jgi:hypothetical protein
VFISSVCIGCGDVEYVKFLEEHRRKLHSLFELVLLHGFLEDIAF